MTVEESRQESPDRVGMSTRSWLRPAAIVALLSIAVAAYIVSSDVEEPITAPADQLRMPAGKPLLEPDRPDLIGDPGIATDEEEQGDIPDE